MFNLKPEKKRKRVISFTFLTFCQYDFPIFLVCARTFYRVCRILEYIGIVYELVNNVFHPLYGQFKYW